MRKITISSFRGTTDKYGNEKEKEYDKEKVNVTGWNFTSIHEQVGYYSFTKIRALPHNVCQVDGDNPNNITSNMYTSISLC